MLQARVSTRALETAVKRLPLERYPARLAVIDAELQRRRTEERTRRAA